MKFLIFLGLLICIFALVSTLMLTKVEDKEYSSQKSLSNLSSIYLLLFPLIIIVVIIGLVVI